MFVAYRSEEQRLLFVSPNVLLYVPIYMGHARIMFFDFFLRPKVRMDTTSGFIFKHISHSQNSRVRAFAPFSPEQAKRLRRDFSGITWIFGSQN